MNKNILKKTLAVGVIFLFIGVTVAPSTAVDIPNKEDVTLVNDTSEDDCDCEILDEFEINQINRLFNKLEVVIGFILLKYSNNPEIVEKCNEISRIINSDGILEEICIKLSDLAWDFLIWLINQPYSEEFILIIIMIGLLTIVPILTICEALFWSY